MLCCNESLYGRSIGFGQYSILYPEVISYEKLHDGTLKLTIEAVWEIRMLDQAITSELIIKPMKDGSFQYLSNKVIKSDQNANAGWYMPRLTEEEWKANYSNN